MPGEMPKRKQLCGLRGLVKGKDQPLSACRPSLFGKSSEVRQVFVA